jgi:tRNA nucleotidyltransferase (CCA-adding enzyme)
MNEFVIPNYIKEIINLLKENGYEAYLVGGCVRDFLMGRTPNDLDMTTSATPDEMLSVFSDYKVIKTGLKHGTITVFVDKNPVEITTYRIDGEYLDNRHPSEVTFTRNLTEDLKRRDFTINAMAYNEDGLVDCCGGIDDVNEKIIRAVGEPDRRFLEDALRILRALRFSSVLSFDIDKHTEKSARKNAKLLKKISAERILVELNKLLLGKNAKEVVVKYSDILSEVSPELFHDVKKKIRELSVYPNSLIVIYTILMNHLSAFEAEEVMSFLKFSNSGKKSVLSLLWLSRQEIPKSKMGLKLFISEAGFDVFEDYFLYLDSFGIDTEALKEYFAQIKVNKECCFISDLAINGNDLSALGIKDGKKIGEILRALLFAVIEEKAENKSDSLANYVINNYLA